MSEKRIDVVIPAYNPDFGFFAECLESVERQTIFDQGWSLRVALVDDGSEIPWPEVFMPVEVIRKAHSGVSDTRNVGARSGSAPFIAFLDCDDTWEPTKLEKSIAAIGDRELCVCTSGIFFNSRARVVIGERVTRQSLLKIDHVLTSPVMTREAFEMVGFDPEFKVAEDLDFAFRALRAGIPYVHVYEPLVFYRKHEGNLTVNHRPLLQKTALEIRRREGRIQ